MVAGEDLSLPVLVAKMAGSEKVWKAVVTFCEEVVLQKETAERIRRQGVASPTPAGVAAAAAANSGKDEEGSEAEGETLTPPTTPSATPHLRRSRRLMALTAGGGASGDIGLWGGDVRDANHIVSVPPVASSVGSSPPRYTSVERDG